MSAPTPRRALLSVYDKTGIVDLGRSLVDLGWELVSSGGTASLLAAEGIAVTEVAEMTQAPEMLGGRVKTLHPVVHGGILADRSDPAHMHDLGERGITPIDLVVGNLYPFTSDPGIELIDIGGPTMVRAAAKNHAHVGVLVDPADYGPVVDELRADGWPGRRSPTPRHTTPPSWPGSMTIRPRTTPLTPSSPPCTWPWNGCRTSGTARTPTRWVPGTGPRERRGGGTPRWCTAERPCRT